MSNPIQRWTLAAAVVEIEGEKCWKEEGGEEKRFEGIERRELEVMGLVGLWKTLTGLMGF